MREIMRQFQLLMMSGYFSGTARKQKSERVPLL